MLSVFVFVFYALGIGSAIEAVMTVRTSQGAVAWAVALVSFPFLSVPAYWVFGRSKFEGFLEAYEANKAEIDSVVNEMHQNLNTDALQPSRPAPAYDAIRALTGHRLVGRNDVELLINGERTFDSILAGIAAASDYVLVQFYMIHDDGLGRRLQNALIERAKAGVRVFLLYDEVGSSGLPASYIARLTDAGAEVSSFRPTQGFRNRFQINFRNHRKIVVVDGEIGWVGGHNVGDEYLGLDADFSPWRDTHVRIEGPAAIQLQSVMLSDWYWATRTLPELNWQPEPADDNDMLAMIIPSAPTQKLETAGLMYVLALNEAKKRIWLTAPYFVPDEAVMKALELAALRGVDVRIILPGKGDSMLVFLAAYHYVARLANLGIRFYEYVPGFLHEKVALIDDDTSLVGTANFDNRSFRLNFEVTAMVYDAAFAKKMEKMLRADFKHSRQLVAEDLDKRSFWWRLKVSVAALASPAL
ncbi:MAG TPA: cardiolipin synthase [Woeseiaceae bacterium]|nr:cardiolipin synthase [Woeseiaceae bacterium]